MFHPMIRERLFHQHFMSKFCCIFIILVPALNTSVFSQATSEGIVNQPTRTNTLSTGGDCEWCKRKVSVYACSESDPDFISEYAGQWLAGILGDNCAIVEPIRDPIPEYVISVRFEKAPDGRFPMLHLPGYYFKPKTTEDNKLIKAAMVIVIIFVGGDANPRGSMTDYPLGFENFYGNRVWMFSVVDTSMSLEAVKQKMTPHLLALKPLKEFLWNYEKTPVSCKINLQKEYLAPGEEMEIVLSDFKDINGGKPTSLVNNKILVVADPGRILNDDMITSVFNPGIKIRNYYAFEKQNKLVIRYKAPDQECTEDDIEVWNSCEIRDEPFVSYEETPLKQGVAWKTIKTKCYNPFSGTVMYERIIKWNDKQPTGNGYVEQTRELAERATLNLTFGYTHTYNSSDESEDYYDDPIKASGTYSVTITNVDYVVDEKNGGWNKIEETANGSGNLEEVNGFMTLNYDTGKYTLNLDFTSPEITGKTVISSDGGVIGEDTFTYMFNGYGTQFEGTMSGKQMSGSWSLPAGKNQVVTGEAGKVPGANFNWSFGR